MNSLHITRAHLRLRVHGSRREHSEQADRIVRCSRELKHWGKSLEGEEVFASHGSSEKVYVIRHLVTRLILGYPGKHTDQELRRTLGVHIAKAVEESINRPSSEVVVFENRAAYIAAFLQALFERRAWTSWVYEPLARFRSSGTEKTAGKVLREHEEIFPAILRRLQESGGYDANWWSRIPAEDVVTLWRRQLGESGGNAASVDDASRHSDLVALWNLISDLANELVDESIDHRKQATARDHFMQRFAGGLDWNDARGLAEAVFEGLRDLVGGRLVTRVHIPGGWDWLDRDWLEQRLRAWSEESLQGNGGRDSEASNRPALPASGLPHENNAVASFSRRQRKLLADLAHALHCSRLNLGSPHPGSADFQIRWFSALLIESEGWEDDRMAAAMIQRLANAIIATSTGDSTARAEAEAFLQAVTAVAPGLRSLWRRPVDATSGSSSVDPLPTRPPRGGSSDTRLEFHSPVAGIFLLARAANDLGLARLARGALPDDPAALRMLLAALALRWAGEQSVDENGLIDRAIQEFAGGKVAYKLEAWRSWWGAQKDDHLLSLQAGLLQALLERNEISRSGFRVHGAALTGHADPVLVMGDVRARHWVRGVSSNSANDVSTQVRLWRREWTALGGDCHPELLVEGQGEQRQTENSDAPQQQLDDALASFPAFSLGSPLADLSATLLANSALRLWASWFTGFQDSSTRYLLDQFVRRGGWVERNESKLLVRLEARPLDVVLEKAGYFQPLAHLAWMPGQTLAFERRE